MQHRTVWLALLCTLFAPILCPLCFAGQGPDSADKPVGKEDQLAAVLGQLDQQWWDASAKHDVETLGRLAAGDFVGFDGEQHRWSRGELLEHLKAVHTADVKRVGGREVLRLDDHAAVLTYEVEFKTYAGDRLLDHAHQRVSASWVERDGEWRVRFSQVTNLATPPAVAAAPPAPQNPAPAPAVPDRPQAPRGPVVPRIGQAAARPAAGDIAWGEAEKGGLQFGAALADPSKKGYGRGEAIPFVLLVRNTADHPVHGQYHTQDAFYEPPKVVDANGREVKVDPPTVTLGGIWAILDFKLKPGEEKQLATATLSFEPDVPPDHPGTDRMIARAGRGVYKVIYPNSGPLQVEIK